jgi:hypothetical protein
MAKLPVNIVAAIGGFHRAQQTKCENAIINCRSRVTKMLSAIRETNSAFRHFARVFAKSAAYIFIIALHPPNAAFDQDAFSHPLKGTVMKTMMLCVAAALTAGAVHATVPSANHATTYAALTTTRTTTVSMTPLSPASESREYQRIRGSYALESGGSLTVSRDGRRLFVEITNQPRVEVRFDARGTLVSLDGRTTFRFREAPNGLIAQVVMTQEAGATTAMGRAR